jgi:hypothetical protein
MQPQYGGLVSALGSDKARVDDGATQFDGCGGKDTAPRAPRLSIEDDKTMIVASRDLASDSSADCETQCAIKIFLILNRTSTPDVCR